MIFGSIEVDEHAVNTHRDSYMLAQLTAVSVRRPFMPGAVLLAGGFAAFAVNFADLLYAHEIQAIAGFCIGAFAIGFWTGQLKLLSRDLRGSELADVVWGSYRHLNRVRREIASAMRGVDGGVRS